MFQDFGTVVLDATRPVLGALWPFIALIVLFPLFLSTWKFWRQMRFEHHIKWVLLEIHIPRIIEKSPRAMEQVLAAIYTLRNAPGQFAEHYWHGEVTRWYTFEMVSFGGQVHLYARVYRKQRGLVEAAFFSYYPDLEITEVDEDYVDKLPKNYRELTETGYDVWGSEMILAKPEIYPIKTYTHFESPDEDKQFDPISVFFEVLSKIKKEEIVGIQFQLAPADDHWYK
ncbi:MAG: hypothetical protein HY536_01150, partial [Candidatus Colwellbacteria bacterium]|nr:hypothetical protein [Candidatus Colwellbacteria bacterium]